MRRAIAAAAAALILSPALAGCASRADLTAVSSKNVNLSNMRIDPERAKGRTVGEDCQKMFLFVPTGGPPTLDEAIDRALEAEHANVLVDAVVNWHTFYIPLIYGETCWRAEGVAYDTFQ